MNNALTLYQRSADFLWTDPHIAKQMLKLHLDPENDAASRNAKSIGAAVQWISSRVPAKGSIVDLGCGPGLYAEQLAALGFGMTGIDISKNTIRYASSSARRKKLNISYLNRSYLADPIPGAYDATL